MTDFKAKIHQIPPQTPLGELTALLDPFAGLAGRFAAAGGAGLGKRRLRGGEEEGGGRGGEGKGGPPSYC